MKDKNENNLEYGIRKAIQTNKITELVAAMLPVKKADFVVEVFDKDYNRRRVTVKAKIVDEQIINPFSQKKLYEWVRD